MLKNSRLFRLLNCVPNAILPEEIRPKTATVWVPLESHASGGDIVRFTREKLTQPPVLEVIASIHADFEREPPLVPGLFYASASERLPKFEELFLQSPHGLAPTHRFRSENDEHLVQLAPGFVSIHQMGVYSVYEDFAERVESELQEVFKVARPVRLHRVSLRYVNFFPSTEGADVSQIGLTIPCHQLLPTDPQVSSEMAQARSVFPFEHGKLAVFVAHPRVIKNQTGAILDLEFGKAWDDDKTDIRSIIDWMATAHEEVYQAFRSALSPETYAALAED